jgi:hypothetical protein
MTLKDVTHRSRCRCSAGRVSVDAERIGLNFYDIAISRRHVPRFCQTNRLRCYDSQFTVHGTRL